MTVKRRNHDYEDCYEVDQNDGGLAACMRAKFPHTREDCTGEQRQARADFKNQSNIGIARGSGAQKALIQRTASLPPAGWIASWVPILCDRGDCDSALSLRRSLRAHWYTKSLSASDNVACR